ncbi:MAG: hypothetical protein IPK76_00260 [Lewinellaceae bacterium]|nr:hypothetical protein [Lewinellaceae bacterium]
MDRFFDGLGSGEFSPTKSALVQARQKLLPRFFRDFFMFGVMLFSMTTFAADPKPAGADISEILLLLRRFNLLPEF